MNALLNEREQTHGKYKQVATTAQDLKDVMHKSRNWLNLADGQREALELMATKVARILNGNSDEIDHWQDIAGYAELVATDLKT